MSSKKEQGFNDAELQDIMSEIENLEREYDEDKPAEKVEAAHEPIDDIDDIQADLVDETPAAQKEESEESNVVSFSPKSTGTHKVEFQGAGEVNFSLNFEVAGQIAHLEITDAGLVVSLDGMNLSIDEQTGCTVEMDGGVKFSVPMGHQAANKKAA